MIRNIFPALMGLVLAACTTPANTNAANGAAAMPAQQSPAQIAAQVCPPLQLALTGLQADTGLPQGALHDLVLAAPQVQSLCASAALANSTNVATLENLAFSVVLPIAQTQNPKLAADLLAAQIILSVVQAAQVAPPAVAPAIASPAAK